MTAIRAISAKEITMMQLRRIALLPTLLLLLYSSAVTHAQAYPGVRASAFAGEPMHVSVMTQNMDAGTDLTFVIGGLLGVGGLTPDQAVALTYQEIVTSAAIPQRAALLAAKVAAEKPDLLALQEATLWRTGASVDTATTVLFDQLELLRSDLAADGVPYDIVAVNSLTDVALPFPASIGGAFRFTDRDVLLVRAGLRRPAFHLSDVKSKIFTAEYPLAGLEIPSGYISVIVHSGDRDFRLISTHLQTAIEGDSVATAVQIAQAQQILKDLHKGPLPAVIAGDFNSDAIAGTSGAGPDNTATAALIEAAGYADTWSVLNSISGPTWPFYLEDKYPPPFVVHATPFERIDLIFSKDLDVTSVKHIVAPGPAAHVPYFASDHAGVLAVFQFREKRDEGRDRDR
jgi:endonuclease/exonuclease/phosphatase family metal-dependent hydrolase